MKEFSTSDANETEDRGKTAEVNLFQSSDRPIVRKNSMKKIRISKSFDSFRKLRQNRVYYVDKTMLLQEYLVDNFKEGVLFARPRRFGKTLPAWTVCRFRERKAFLREDLFFRLVLPGQYDGSVAEKRF